MADDVVTAEIEFIYCNEECTCHSDTRSRYCRKKGACFLYLRAVHEKYGNEDYCLVCGQSKVHVEVYGKR